MKDYFKLQFILINRKIEDAGMKPALGYILGLIAFVLLSIEIFIKTEYAKYLVILICLSLQFKLSEKNRTEFLQSTFGDKIKNNIRILENLIICVPFIIILLFNSCFVEAIFLILYSIMSALFSFQTTFNLTIPTPFSKKPFEFSRGFRTTFFMFPIAYILTCIAIHVDNLNLGIFALLLVFLTTLNYYFMHEPEYYVWVHGETPKMFLKNKIFNASKNTILLTAPIVISLFIFYPQEFHFILLFLLIGLLFLWTIILAKYSAYPKGRNIIVGIVFAFSFFFPPLLLAIMPFLYFKSINKLNVLLHDKN